MPNTTPLDFKFELPRQPGRAPARGHGRSLKVIALWQHDSLEEASGLAKDAVASYDTVALVRLADSDVLPQTTTSDLENANVNVFSVSVLYRGRGESDRELNETVAAFVDERKQRALKRAHPKPTAIDGSAAKNLTDAQQRMAPVSPAQHDELLRDFYGDDEAADDDGVR